MMTEQDYLPIAEHGLIGDLQTSALVTVDGTIDWLCLPRFDSPSVFSALLDAERGGHWRMAPTCEVSKTHQFYFPDSAVLVTRFLSEDGVVEVQDFMPVGPAGRESSRAVIRRVLAVPGAMELRTEVRPRFSYGRQAAVVESEDEGLVFVGDELRLRLRASVELEAGESQATATFSLDEGDAVAFVMEFDRGSGAGVIPIDVDDALRCFDATVAFWRDWLAQGTYRGRWREMVLRSALTLKLLTHRPTGAVLAAPTAALPERIGGERNWDYRYVWSRDAAFSPTPSCDWAIGRRHTRSSGGSRTACETRMALAAPARWPSCMTSTVTARCRRKRSRIWRVIAARLRSGSVTKPAVSVSSTSTAR
jgi:GH15 family glucan-1,4-alpha-glucosidase